MTSKALSELVGLRYETIARRTKKALEAGEHTLSFDGVVYVVEVVHNERGKSYEYHEQTTIIKRKTVSKQISFTHLNELDGFEVNATKHTAKEKLLLMTFIGKYNYTMKIIIESLLLRTGEPSDKKRIDALNRKFLRWQKAFKEGGASALEDKRGKTRADFIKIDEEILIKSIEGAGARGIRENYYGVWDLYCYAYQERYTKVFNPKNEEIISYTAITKGIKKLLKKHALLKAYWTKGHDGINQSYPVGIKNITYTNQEWQVDATKFDFMVKLINEDGTFNIARYNLTAVIDVYSSNAVATLTTKIDSYAQVRVLNKAFIRMGKPEQVYMDNGKDYTSYHYGDVLSDMGITAINAQVGQGRQKGKIERFFGVIQTELAKIPGYIGNNVAKRTDIENQTASKIDIRTSQATRIDEARLLLFDEMQTIINNTLAKASQNYKIQEHNLLDSKELEEIRRKLGKKDTRPLHADGIKLNGFTYISSDLWVNGLATGDKLEVYEDIDDINTIYAYKDGKFISKALNREMGIEAMSLEEHKEAKKADRKNNVAPREKSIKECKELLERYQDQKTKELLEYTPEYAKPKETIVKEVVKEEKNNDYMDFINSQMGA